MCAKIMAVSLTFGLATQITTGSQGTLYLLISTTCHEKCEGDNTTARGVPPVLQSSSSFVMAHGGLERKQHSCSHDEFSFLTSVDRLSSSRPRQVTRVRITWESAG